MGRKICSYCSKRKNQKSFSRNKNCQDGYDVRCKKCIKKRTKIVNELRKTAPNKKDFCECCKKKPENLGGRRITGLVLDHDPITNEFRGWLCDKCNKAIGMLGDDISGVVNAINYLIQTKYNKK
jgi:hypothetical protein